MNQDFIAFIVSLFVLSFVFIAITVTDSIICQARYVDFKPVYKILGGCMVNVDGAHTSR